MASVKFPHRVKFNGKYYAPGTPIEIDKAAEYADKGAQEKSEKTAKRATKPSGSRKNTRKKQ